MDSSILTRKTPQALKAIVQHKVQVLDDAPAQKADFVERIPAKASTDSALKS